MVSRFLRRAPYLVLLPLVLVGCGAEQGTPTSPQEATQQNNLTQQGVQNANAPTATESSQDALTRQGAGGGK